MCQQLCLTNKNSTQEIYNNHYIHLTYQKYVMDDQSKNMGREK